MFGPAPYRTSNDYDLAACDGAPIILTEGAKRFSGLGGQGRADAVSCRCFKMAWNQNYSFATFMNSV